MWPIRNVRITGPLATSPRVRAGTGRSGLQVRARTSLCDGPAEPMLLDRRRVVADSSTAELEEFASGDVRPVTRAKCRPADSLCRVPRGSARDKLDR